MKARANGRDLCQLEGRGKRGVPWKELVTKRGVERGFNKREVKDAESDCAKV